MSGAWDGFTQEASVAWGLGSYDSPDVVFNGLDSFGVEWVASVPEGWNTTTVDTPLLQGAGDGGWFSPGRRVPKVMTLRGAFRCPDQTRMDAAEARLRAAVENYLGADTTLWHSALPTGAPARQATVRPTGAVSCDYVDSNPRIRTFSAVLTAADPLKYAAGSAGLLSFTTTLAQTALGGITFPVHFPLNFGATGGVGGGRISLANPGTVPVLPTATYSIPAGATGSLDTPTLRHLTLGVSEGVSYQMQPGDSIVVDHRYRTVLLNGGVSLFAARIDGTSFFPIVPGQNDLYFAANALNTAASATVSFRPAWS